MFEETSFYGSALPLLFLWNCSDGVRALHFKPSGNVKAPPLPTLREERIRQPSVRDCLLRKDCSLPDTRYRLWLGLWPLLNPVNSPGCLNIINQKKLWHWITNIFLLVKYGDGSNDHWTLTVLGLCVLCD